MAMASADYDGFRHYCRRPIRAEFQKHENKSEEDLVEALKYATIQQEQVLRSSSSFHSNSTKVDSSIRGIGRAHATIRQKTNKLKQAWLSSSSSRLLRSLDEPAQVLVPWHNSAVIEPWISEEKSHIQQGIRLERRPARREVRRLEKEKRKTLKELEKHEREDLRRRITEAQERGRVEQHKMACPQSRPEIDSPDTPLSSGSRRSWKRPLLMLGNQSRLSKHIIPMPGDFSSKSDLATYMNPTDDALSQPQIAELPADPPPYNCNEASDLLSPLAKTNAARDFIPSSSNREMSPEAPPVLAAPDEHYSCEGSSKPMLCDSCYSAIGLSESYYYCKICDGGDRIVCAPCANAGRRCRHTSLEERISSIKRTTGTTAASRPEMVAQPRPISEQAVIHDRPKDVFKPEARSLSHKQVEKDSQALQTEGFTPSKDQIMVAAKAEIDSFEAFQRAQTLYREYEKRGRGQVIDSCPPPRHERELEWFDQDMHRRGWEYQRREQEISLRERELSLHERQSAFREQQLNFREQESMARERMMLHLTDSRIVPTSASGAPYWADTIAQNHHPLHSGLTQMVAQPASFEPTRDLSSPPAKPRSGQPAAVEPLKTNLFEPVRKIVEELMATSIPPRDINDGHVTAHGQHAGNKRKAASSASHSRTSSADAQVASLNLPSHADQENECDTDDGEDEKGTPKRRRQTESTTTVLQRLLPCPYAKFDPARYSERNTSEKQYRGCSGRFLTDISRLKQHLYRVHRRPEHYCPRCFQVFKTKIHLDDHARQRVSCRVSECHFAEKFTEDKVKELKRKRPGMSVEDNWFHIFGILFPGVPLPGSPYGDDTTDLAAVDPISGSTPETSHLLEIFNEQLSAQQSETAQSISIEARDLISQTLARSMAELLRRMSPSSTPQMGRTPSILVSPTDTQPRSTLRTPVSSVPTTPVSTKRSNSSKRAKWLTPLDTDIEPKTNPVQEILPATSAAPLRRKALITSPGEQKDRTAYKQKPPEPQIPDMGEFESLLAGDHVNYEDMIGLANSDFDFGFDKPANECTLDGPTDSHGKFVPEKTSTPKDDGPDTSDSKNPPSLKMTSSKRSLDSGYGSMHSHSHSRDRSRDLHDAEMTLGHATHEQNHAAIMTNPPITSASVTNTTLRKLGSNEDLAFLDRGMYETLAQDLEYDYTVYDHDGT